MKKETAFIALMILFGAVLGLGITAIFAAIAVPNYSQLMLTHAEKADFELLNSQFGWLTGSLGRNVMLTVFGLLAVAGAVLFILILNPHFRRVSTHRTGRWKQAVVLISCLALCYPFILAMDSLPLFKMDTSTAFSGIAGLLALAFAAGLIWLLAGETGWAGDFSSWKAGLSVRQAGVADKRPRLVQGFVLGAIAGGAVYVLLSLNSWAFTQFFILVSEVLDESGETSSLGFRYIAYELIFTFTVSLGIAAGLVTALSPTYREKRERLRLLVFPAVLFAAAGAIVMGVYLNAALKYDLGKRSFAEALGVPEKSSASRTMVIFIPKKGAAGTTLQEWPMQVSGTSFIVSGPVELSYDNLRKVEEYLEAHKDGSVFTYAARDILMKGYHALGDAHKGIEWQFKSSTDMMIPRSLLVTRLKYLPVTQKNLNYLKSFADETTWHIGGKYALRLAEAYMHFGMAAEAKAWVRKAKERGADVSSVAFLSEPVLTDGRISGKITVNGKLPANVTVMLLKYDKTLDKISEWSLARILVDVRKPDASGRFSFDRLGSGEYFIALMTDKEVIQYDVPADRVAVKNLPGAIKLGRAAASRDLGDIRVSVKK